MSIVYVAVVSLSPAVIVKFSGVPIVAVTITDSPDAPVKLLVDTTAPASLGVMVMSMLFDE